MDPYQRLEVEYAKAINNWGPLNNLADPERLVVCSSGTAALHLALETATIPFNSHVIVPDYTMIACARAVTLADLHPIFGDCTESLLMDLSLIDKLLMNDVAVREHTEALMTVHVYGRMSHQEHAAQIANTYDLFLMEDMAEAHGLQPHPRTDAACWSFYRNKIVAGEEGGAILFRNPKDAVRARQLRSMGFTADHDYRHLARGNNYRLSNVHSHLILDSLDELPMNLEARLKQVMLYDHFCPDMWRMPPRQSPWVYDMRIRGLKKAGQDLLVNMLKREGIQARHGFVPMTRQPEYHQRDVKSPVADRLCSEIIYLPVHPRYVTADTIEKAMRLIRAAVKVTGTA